MKPFVDRKDRRDIAASCLHAILANPKTEPEDVIHNVKVAIQTADTLLYMLGQPETTDEQP